MYGAQLFAKRKELGLSRAKLARLLGVTERTIVRWEAYTRPIPADVATWAETGGLPLTLASVGNPAPLRQRTHGPSIPGLYWDNRRGYYRRRTAWPEASVNM
jgi:transcriptional regulator with XRE-family HTH domain